MSYINSTVVNNHNTIYVFFSKLCNGTICYSNNYLRNKCTIVWPHINVVQ